jgi:hypothetical protein
MNLTLQQRFTIKQGILPLRRHICCVMSIPSIISPILASGAP